MIVTCPDCDTSFQLDESRIPQKGIRVRCSRCKHAFHLAHPSASRSEAIDDVVQEAVTNGGTPSPSTTRDLVDPGTSASAAAPREEINNEDAAEWEFNQDIPDTAGEDDVAGDDGGPLDGHVGGEAPSGLDLAANAASAEAEPAVEPAASAETMGASPVAAVRDEPPAPQPESQVQIEEEAAAEGESGLDLDDGLDVDSDADTGLGVDAAGADASAFGSVDDFSSLMDDDPLDAIAAPQADETADEFRAQAAEQSGVYAAEGHVDDLGDPEKWDFFDGASPAPESAPAPKATLGRIGQLSGSAAGSDDVSISRSPTPVADLAEKGRIAHLVESAGRIVGWTVVLVGFALGLVSGLWGTAESFVVGERVTPVGPLEAVDMKAEWVDTARAGRLLVVSGGLRNPARTTAKIPGALEIALLDRLGDPLDLPSVSAGVALSERQLRELPAEVLTRVRAQAATQLQSASIPPGGQLPFQVLIFDAPPSGLRFEARLSESGRLSLPEPVVAEPEPAAVEDAGDGLDASAALDVAPPQAHGASDAVGVEPGAASADPAAPAAEPGPASPGYDDPYGDDAGMGLQDL